MKKISRNIVVAIFSKFLLILSGIITQRFILVSFGSEINGLSSSINQILAYFTLLEAGLGTASIQALYKPLSKRDWEGTSKVLSASQIQYRRIGLSFLSLLTILSFSMHFVIHSNLNYWFVVTFVFISGLGNVISYSFVGRYQVLLNADQKIYILHIIDSVLGILSCILKILIINAGFSILLVQGVMILLIVIRLSILYIYIKFNYKKIDYKAVPDMQATRKRWSVLIHNIVGMITNHTDIIVLTILSTLKNVSVYSVYNYIFSNITTLITTTFLQAPLATFGHLIEKKDPNFKKYYDLFEFIFTIILFIVLTTVLIMSISFITLYTKTVTDVNYIDYILAILFTVSSFFYMIRTPVVIIINASGHFKETQIGAILEAVINFCISIPMFYIMGIRGLIVGTIVALMYRSVDLIIYTYKNILFKTYGKFIILIFNNLTISIIIIIIITCININITSWLQWILISGIVLLSVTAMFFFNAILFYRKNLKLAFSIVKDNFIMKK